MKYYSAGQISVDKTTFSDGSVNGPHLGGTGIFGYGGIRIWTDEVAPLLNIASDFYDFYGDWIKKNNVNCDYLNLSYDNTFFVDMKYQENGYYESIYTIQEKIDNAFLYGYSNCRLEQIANIANDSSALYIYYEPINTVYWKNLRKIRESTGLKVMWEPGFSVCNSGFTDSLLKVMDTLRPDMSTLNLFEASALFETDDEEKIIEKIEKLDIPFFFLRCGKRGAYALSGGKRFFIPSIDIEGYKSVDPTGCGNASTAGAMYGWVETGDPVMAAVIGNVSGGFNVGQFGVIPSFDDTVRSTAFKTARNEYKRLIAENRSWAKELLDFNIKRREELYELQPV